MPIYEYQCQACEHLFDVLQKMSDDRLTYCPECGEPKLRKLVSAPNFRLKGGGWYETDFKDKNQRNLAGANDSGSGGASAKDSGSKDSGAKDSGSKDSGKNDSGSKKAATATADAKTSKTTGSSDSKKSTGS